MHLRHTQRPYDIDYLPVADASNYQMDTDDQLNNKLTWVDVVPVAVDGVGGACVIPNQIN